MPSIFLAGRRSAASDTLLAATLAAVFSTGAFAQQGVDVAMRDGLLSIRANGTSAAELAAALAQETGIRVVVTGDAGQGLTTEIVEVPLVKAIALLSPNHLLVRGKGGASAPVIEIVLMLDETGGDGAGGEETEFLPSGAPADEIEAGEPSPEIYGDEQTFVEEEPPFEEPPEFSEEPAYEDEAPPFDESPDFSEEPPYEEDAFVPDEEFVPDEAPPFDESSDFSEEPPYEEDAFVPDEEPSER